MESSKRMGGLAVKPGAWTAGSPQSTLEFSLRHLVLSQIRGRAARWEAIIVADFDEPERSSVEVVVDAASIETGDEERDRHIRSGEFLDVRAYPTIRFVSRTVRPDAQHQRFAVTGDLTIRAVTREITIDIHRPGPSSSSDAPKVLELAGRVTIDRQLFGLRWNQDLDTGGVVVGDKIEIDLRIEARPGASVS